MKFPRNFNFCHSAFLVFPIIWGIGEITKYGKYQLVRLSLGYQTLNPIALIDLVQVHISISC